MKLLAGNGSRLESCTCELMMSIMMMRLETTTDASENSLPP